MRAILSSPFPRVSFLMFMLLALPQLCGGQPTHHLGDDTHGATPTVLSAEEIVSAGVAVVIKSKTSQKVLTVNGNVSARGVPILQLNLNGGNAQKFSFESIDGTNYHIRTSTGGYYLTASRTASPRITQELLLRSLPVHGGTTHGGAHHGSNVADSVKALQEWQVEKANEIGAYIISNRGLPGMALHSPGNASGVNVAMASKDGRESEKWVLKYTTFEGKPNSDDALKGLVANCSATFSAFWFFHSSKDIANIFPEWRTVGEDYVPDGITTFPKFNPRVLEGVVADTSAHVAFEDFPTSHFTHDMDFDVIPDPAFRYLLADHNDGTYQQKIEVEWESGIAQGEDKNKNPAATLNRKGESYGFYTAGHTRYDEIWNWPTNKDWVHVEGNWIFDKGHPPANTEIHPPQFVGIKRYLPEKYVVGTGNFAFSTRCDIFANGDGSAMWNNKGHDSFARHVRMSQRVFIVTFTHDLPRPNANAHLTFGWKVQKGDSYTGHPTVTVFENGTADIPQPHVMFILPWANDHVPDNAVFARTLFLYWDDLPQHGVPINYPMRVLNVQIDSVIVLDKKEGGDSDAGEYILFANLGNRWWFLNEFVGVNDIISDGLGTVWDPFYSARHPISTGNGTRPFPQPSDAKFIFSFDLFCEVCLPPGKEFRMSVSGWERDYIDGQFGRILDQYMSCEDARHTLESQFNGDYISQGGLDDPVGTADVVVHYSDQWQPQYSVFSRGSMQHGEDSHIGNTNPNRAFQAKYRVKR